jgi:hypothetical protein
LRLTPVSERYSEGEDMLGEEAEQSVIKVVEVVAGEDVAEEFEEQGLRRCARIGVAEEADQAVGGKFGVEMRQVRAMARDTNEEVQAQLEILAEGCRRSQRVGRCFNWTEVILELVNP